MLFLGFVLDYDNLFVLYQSLKLRKMVAFTLDYFKVSSDQNVEASLALPQPNSVLDSLQKMNNCLMGDEEIAMAPLSIYPKGFKPWFWGL